MKAVPAADSESAQQGSVVRLDPMTLGEFEAFLERDIRKLAQERSRAGYWSQTESLARSRKEHRLLLPSGMKSRYHHFFTIREVRTGDAVGTLWFKTDLDSSRGSAHIFSLEIEEAFRRRGFARQAMLELERLARGMGLRQLGLHVFAHSEAARALAETLGYSTAGLNMLKDL